MGKGQCQLKKLDRLGAEKYWLFDQYERGIQILQSVKQDIYRLRYGIMNGLRRTETTHAVKRSTAGKIEEGDVVRVKAEEEIKKILDANGKYKGCMFIGRMYQFCGKEFTVHKKIDQFYDEVKQKMCKCNDMVQLDTVLCEGDQKFYFKPCDRRCFYFWHVDWLERVDK